MTSDNDPDRDKLPDWANHRLDLANDLARTCESPGRLPVKIVRERAQEFLDAMEELQDY